MERIEWLKEEVVNKIFPYRSEELVARYHYDHVWISEIEQRGFKMSIPSSEVREGLKVAINGMADPTPLDQMFIQSSDPYISYLISKLRYLECEVTDTGMKLSEKAKKDLSFRQALKENAAELKKLAESVKEVEKK